MIKDKVLTSQSDSFTDLYDTVFIRQLTGLEELYVSISEVWVNKTG